MSYNSKYFNKKNSFLHGIMFHHFHDQIKHKKQQGSISKNDFRKIINYIGRDNIINAEEFKDAILKKKQLKNKVCFTFDDSLKCQFDVAVPVLDEYEIKSFFFIYSSLYDNKPDMLEVYRYFRMNSFKSIDVFYKSFYKIFSEIINYFDLKNYEKKFQKQLINYKKKSPYLSYNDIKFRITRDYILKNNDYAKIMLLMFKRYNFDYKPIMKKLYLTKNNLNVLKKNGHIIGMHSHNHPTILKQLSYKKQLLEYKKNKKFIKDILGIDKVETMSHPNGSYNMNTLEILKDLKVVIGFKPSMLIDGNIKNINNTNLEIARENHSIIAKRIKK